MNVVADAEGKALKGSLAVVLNFLGHVNKQRSVNFNFSAISSSSRVKLLALVCKSYRPTTLPNEY